MSPSNKSDHRTHRADHRARLAMHRARLAGFIQSGARSLPVLALALTTCASALCQRSEPLRIVSQVANGIIRDTRFAFQLTPQQEDLGMQTLDFRFLHLAAGQKAFAFRRFHAEKDTIVQIALTGTGRITVWLNKQKVFQQEKGDYTTPVEFAYNRFRFSHSFPISLRKGENELLVGYEGVASQSAPGIVFLRAQTPAGDQDASLRFGIAGPLANWLFTGPLPSAVQKNAPGQDQDLLRADPIHSRYAWENAPARLLPQLAIDSHAVYTRDSYADWSYPNGILMWTILQLGDAAADSSFIRFVKKYTSFTLQNKACFQWQHDSLFAFRGSFYRLFRQTMLDDAGAPALPFLALRLREKDSTLDTFVTGVRNYFEQTQPRLPDSTFCRPEPAAGTIWADDFFMSTPVLLYMGRLSGQRSYMDEAARQAIGFQEYLCDSTTGLYHHGWFSQSRRQAPVCWGRANGWIAWATAELLDALPHDHPLHKRILENFRRQMSALARFQAADGMWRQVLDDPASYEETSCTAMFSLAMAKGVRKHWLDRSFREKALKGWEGVARHITAEGVVKGICRGTEIGPDREYYNKRPCFDNDPRGLGAVIAAGIEIAKLSARHQRLSDQQHSLSDRQQPLSTQQHSTR